MERIKEKPEEDNPGSIRILFGKRLPPWQEGQQGQDVSEPREGFAKVLESFGLEVPGVPRMDGQLRRVRLQGDEKGKHQGLYMGFATQSGVAAGFVQDLRTGIEATWEAGVGAQVLWSRELGSAGAEAMVRSIHEVAAQEAKEVWQEAKPASDTHPYLARLGVKSYGLREDQDGALLIPTFDPQGKLCGVQGFAQAEDAELLPGARISGIQFGIGTLQGARAIIVAEHYETAAILHEASGLPAVVAFRRENVETVAIQLKEQHPGKALFIAAERGDREEVVEIHSRKAALDVGGHVLCPTFEGKAFSSERSWLDLAAICGVSEVARQVEGALAQLAVAKRGAEHSALEDSSKNLKKAPVSAFARSVAEGLIQQLEDGTAPWQKPWKPGERFLPHNAGTGENYHGVNALWLMAVGEAKGYQDPRWATFKQADELGANVKRGEKGTRLEFWKWYEERPKRDQQGDIIRDAQGKPLRERHELPRPKTFSFVVFNAEQIEGLPPLEEKPALPEWQRHERAEALLQASGVPIKHLPGNRAYYRPSTDEIVLPDRAQFESGDRYYATALHEVGHSTGHTSRLNRDIRHPFGSEAYAREELRAEIASLMLGEELGIGHDPTQHAAYVKSWIKVLKDDPNEIFRAARDAEKIQTFVLDLEREQKQELTVTTSSREGERASEFVSRSVSSREGERASEFVSRSVRLLLARPELQVLQAQKGQEYVGPIIGRDPGQNLLQLVGKQTVVIHPSEWMGEHMNGWASHETGEGLVLSAGMWREIEHQAERTLVSERGFSAEKAASWKEHERAVRSRCGLEAGYSDEDMAAEIAALMVEQRVGPGDAPYAERWRGVFLRVSGAEQSSSMNELFTAAYDPSRVSHFSSWGKAHIEEAEAAVLKAQYREIEAEMGHWDEQQRDQVPEQSQTRSEELKSSSRPSVALKEKPQERQIKELSRLAAALEEFEAGFASGYEDPIDCAEAGIPLGPYRAGHEAGNVAHYGRSRQGDYSELLKEAKERYEIRSLVSASMERAEEKGFTLSRVEAAALVANDRMSDAERESWVLDSESSREKLMSQFELDSDSEWTQLREDLRTYVSHSLRESREQAPPLAPQEFQQAQERPAKPELEITMPTLVRDAEVEAMKQDRREEMSVPQEESSAESKPEAERMQSPRVRVDIPEQHHDPRGEFAEALRSAGFALEGLPEMDGQMKRVRVEGDKGAERSGAYKGYLDGHPAGYLKNWRTGYSENWKSEGPSVVLTARDRAALAAEAAQKRQERAKAIEIRQEKAAELVEGHLKGGSAAAAEEQHPYLQKKGVKAHGVFLDEAGPLSILLPGDEKPQQWSAKGNLLVPVRDLEGKLVGAQSIGPEGFKSFPRGGKLEGCFHLIGEIRKDAPLLIAEGYATAATVHELTGYPVAVAFTANNLAAVARGFRARFPEKVLFIAGDNDRKHESQLDAQGRPKPNVGREKAEAAAKEVEGHVLLPQLHKNQGSDWNDLAQTAGKEEAARQLQAGLVRGHRQELVKAQQQARVELEQGPSQNAEERKRLVQEARAGGGFCRIGNPASGSAIIISEGFSPGDTVHRLTDVPVVAALGAENLLAVARAVRAAYPEKLLYIAGKNEQDREARGELNRGKATATKAAQAVGGHALLPKFPEGSHGSDWSELAQAVGKEEAAQQLAAGLVRGHRQERFVSRQQGNAGPEHKGPEPSKRPSQGQLLSSALQRV